MTIYTAIDRTPFTYLLYCKPTDQYYYGSKYAKSCLPEHLWSTYFTSSKHIKKLIQEHGIDAFTFEIRKIFNCPKKALEWEMKFLNKVKAAQSDKWINKTNGGIGIYTQGKANYVVNGEIRKISIKEAKLHNYNSERKNTCAFKCIFTGDIKLLKTNDSLVKSKLYVGVNKGIPINKGVYKTVICCILSRKEYTLTNWIQHNRSLLKSKKIKIINACVCCIERKEHFDKAGWNKWIAKESIHKITHFISNTDCTKVEK